MDDGLHQPPGEPSLQPWTRTAWTAYQLAHGASEPWLERGLGIRALQKLRLRRIVAHAVRHVAHYRDFGLAPRTVEQLADLPLIRGEALAAHPERFYSEAFPREAVLELDTSGTLGRLKRIRYDARALFCARAAGYRVLAAQARLLGGWKIRSLHFHPPRGTRDAILRFHAARSWLPAAWLADDEEGSVGDPFPVAIARINRHRPDKVTGFGAYVGALLRWGLETRNLRHRPRLVGYGGEHIGAADRRAIVTAGIPIVSSYQCCEALRIAYQCEHQVRHGGGFHIFDDLAALRVVDEDGRTLPPGHSGRLVLSNLSNRATVLLNYVTGDRGQLAPEPCPCGRPGTVLARLEGRDDAMLRRKDGHVVHESLVLRGLFSVAGVRSLQVEQTALDSVIVRVLADQPVEEGLRATLRGLLDDPALRVTVVPVDALPLEPSGKLRSIIGLGAAHSAPNAPSQ